MKEFIKILEECLKGLDELKNRSPRLESVRAHLASAKSNLEAELKEKDKAAKAPPPPPPIPPQKPGGFSMLCLILLMGIVALVFAFTLRGQESFGLTNTIANGTAISALPTNAPGLSTGRAISVVNQEWAGFTFKGQGTGSGTSHVVLPLVRSTSANPPRARTDWETTSAIALNVPMLGTDVVVWHTNLDRGFIGGALWIGINTATNNNGSQSATNCGAWLIKKIIPIRYP